MSTIETNNYFDDYRSVILEDANEWFEDCIKDYDNFDYAWDDMCMCVTGNDGGYVSSLDEEAVIHLIWDSSFHAYCEDMCADMASIFKSIDTTDCFIRYWILDCELHDLLYERWKDKCEE